MATETIEQAPAGMAERTLVDILQRHLAQTRKAYYSSMPGVTYDDMRAAAVRVLEARARYERATGRKVTSKPTVSQIATLLRMNSN